MKNLIDKHPYMAIAGTAVVALIIGVSAGADAQSEQEPDIKTVTETVEVTPDACKTAVEQAGKLQDIYVGVVGVASEYPEMIAEAAQAGLAVNAAKIDEITERLDEGTRKLNGFTADIEKIMPVYNSAVDECLGGGADA